jgi:hypothetical protein
MARSKKAEEEVKGYSPRVEEAPPAPEVVAAEKAKSDLVDPKAAEDAAKEIAGDQAKAAQFKVDLEAKAERLAKDLVKVVPAGAVSEVELEAMEAEQVGAAKAKIFAALADAAGIEV